MPRDTSNRRKWSAQETTLKVQEEEVSSVNYEPSAHEEYLILLQEKNRLVKHLKKKDEKQVELEKREKGFSTYVNGPHNKQKIPATARARQTKTAGHSRLQKLNKELGRLEAEAKKYRSKTAPDRTRRKNWQAGSINLKTHRGEKIRIKAPDILTGEYEDDFEMESVNFAEESGSGHSSDTSSDSESERDREELAAEMQRHADRSSKARDTRAAKKEKEMLTLTIDDVKKLRRSLEMNASIRESMAYCSSDSDSDGEAVSPVQEEDEVEEVLSSSSSEEVGLHPIKADNLIVLQLDSHKKERSEKRVLGVPRRSNSGAYGALKSPSSENPRHHSIRGQPVTPGGQRDIVLKPDGGPRKSSRPLSASRRNKNPTQDSTTEAESVLAALRAENESVMTGVETERRHGTQSAPGRPQSDEDSCSSHGEEEEIVEEYDSDGDSQSARPATVSTGWKARGRPSPGQPGGESRECWPAKSRPEPGQNIDHIVQKVLQLDVKSDEEDTSVSPVEDEVGPRGQKRLLKALAHIEDGSTSKASDSPNSTPTKSKKKPLKATKPVTKMVRSEVAPLADTVEVMVELLSSWGHPSRVGLAEIQFFDIRKQRIFVNPAHVKVQGATSVKGELAALFNGKVKTTKERNMWSCAFSNSRRVRLTLKLHSVVQGQPLELGKIKIWNYNKSLNDLKEGACHIRISLDSQVVFDGELDKGCGNQVFDYGMWVVIRENEPTPRAAADPATAPPDPAGTGGLGATLSHMENVLFHSEDFSDHSGSHAAPVPPLNLPPPSPPVRSETRIMNHSVDRPISLPVVDSPRGVPVPTQSGKTPEQKGEKGRSRSRSHSRDRMEEESGIMRTPRSPAMRRKKLEAQASQEEEEQPGSGENEADLSPRKSLKKKKKLRAKMAARLDGSGSSVELSALKDSMERQESNGDDYSYQNRGSGNPSSPRKHHRSTVSDRDRHYKSEECSQNNFESNRNNNHNESSTGRQARPHWLTEDNTIPAPHPGKRNFPSWLDKTGQIKEGSDDGIIEDEGEGEDEDLLDNWPKTGLSHLPTVLDDGSTKRADRPASGKRTDRPSSSKRPHSGRRAERPSSGRYGEPPTHGRRSRQGQNTPRLSTPDEIADETEEEAYRRQTSGQMANDPALDDLEAVPRMKQIESARAQWRKQEQNRLEESWSSLNVFERSHKGRLSVDMEKDILDEYLNHEPQRPQQPTIEEEPTEDVEEEESFTIPELPKGREMVFNIRTTWGDRHYVGLNGIEVFTSSGDQVKITKIRAEPSDINILPEYSKDPRIVENLIDGVNRTRDDVHVWLAPYVMGQDHKIFLTFDQPHIIAMMRIWNYNKSRIHSYRGARDVEITLDGVPVFKGEIARACGGVLGGSEAFGDTILFTMDEDILEEVSRHDTAFEADALMDLDGDEEEAERPATADRDTVERPFTCAARRGFGPAVSSDDVTDDAEEHIKDESLFGQDLRLNFTATWGDAYYLGLTGLEVVGSDGEGLPLSMDLLDADPRDLHVLPGYEQDDRTLDKLINDVNITTSDENMWLIPYTEAEDHWLRIHFPEPVYISGLRFWNYNKSPEDTYRGAKIVHVSLDGKQLSPPEGYLIRKGPGNCYFDFAQEISFIQTTKSPVMSRLTEMASLPRDSVNVDEEYEAAQVPCGFIYQFQLMSSWGDPYYIGLNGLEFYDNEGNLIKLTENNISAYPDSVNVLEGVEGDVRTPDKLINGINATQDGKSMWLAPVLPGLLNKIYVIFDQPMQISMIKLWNYSKTGNRGVKDFALLVDDLLVYNGILKQVAQGTRGILPTCDIPQQYHTILFSDDSELRRREKHTIILNQTGEQDVQLMNDHEVVNRFTDPRSAHSAKAPDQALRPKTSMVDRSKGNRR